MLYRLTPGGTIKILTNFRLGTTFLPAAKPWGISPGSDLAMGEDGAIYGVTNEGGVFSNGTLFKREPSGRFTYLHHLETYAPKGDLTILDGDFYTTCGNYGPTKLVQVAKNGIHKEIPLPYGETPHLVTTTGGRLLLALQSSVGQGQLWKLNDQKDGFDFIANTSGYAGRLIALKDGGVLAITVDHILKIGADLAITTLHTFALPFEGLGPISITEAADGTYIGATYGGGLGGQGVVFRIVPETKEYTVMEHLVFPEKGLPGLTWLKEVFPYHLPAPGSNRPPCAKDDVIAAGAVKVPAKADPGTLPQVTVNVLRNDFDADKDGLTIAEVGSPTQGTAVIDASGRSITYTAAAPNVKNDSFTYTASDGKGGEARAWVFIRTNPSGKYTGSLAKRPDPVIGEPGGKPEGTISLRLNVNRAVAGSFELGGKKYYFGGRFNEGNEYAKTVRTRYGYSWGTALKLTLLPDGANWIVKAVVGDQNIFFQGTCRPTP